MSKDTLQLPKTTFSMKASLPLKEPEILKKWEKNKIFDKLRKKVWFAAPFFSSLIGSLADTFLFFFIAFYGTELNWLTLGIGDFSVKITMALIMLIPFRILMPRLQNAS